MSPAAAPDVSVSEDSAFSAEQLSALAGHRFPGGDYRIAHWENWLLTDCTGREPMADDLAHPIALFHVPILGARTSIASIFALGGVTATSGAVGLLGYDWEYVEPLREEVTYRVEGRIVSAERRASPGGAVVDDVAFRIQLTNGDRLVARVTNRWRFRRSAAGRAADKPPLRADSSPHPGERIPSWDMPSVDAARMRTMAAILRDPYPVHWDRAGNDRIGLGGRVINQGPLNLGYVANMLMAWAGDDAIRRLTVSFGPAVLDGDHVVAGGAVREVAGGLAHCDVWLTRGDEPVVTGTALVTVPPGGLGGVAP
jgi:acyl dehydratase